MAEAPPPSPPVAGALVPPPAEAWKSNRRRSSSKRTSQNGGLSSEPQLTGVAGALAAQPLFQGCAPCLLKQIAQDMPSRSLAPGELVDLDQERSLLVVESGAICVQVGDGPEMRWGPGAALNIYGMLHLRREYSKEHCSPRQHGDNSPRFQQTLETTQSPPALFDGKLPDENLRYSAQGLSGDAFCFYSLCPQACKEIESMRHLQDSTRLHLRVCGAPAPSSAAAEGGGGSSEAAGGARLAAVTQEAIRHAAFSGTVSWEVSTEMRAAYEVYEKNCHRVKAVWRSITGACGQLFLGMPNEVLWAVAEVSEAVKADADEEVLTEGTSGDAGDDICIIEEGNAIVEKVISLSMTESGLTKIGKLGPGSIVGDLIFLGSQVPRAASVRTMNTFKAIRISSRGLLSVFNRFPGALTTIQRRVDLWARFLKTRIPVAADGLTRKQDGSIEDILGSCNLFAGCNESFLAEVNRAAQWCSFHCGEPLRVGLKDLDRDERAGECVGTLLILVAGGCHWVGGTLHGGDCVQAIEAESLGVRVSTPVAVALILRKADLNTALLKHPKEANRFRRDVFDADCRGLVNTLAKVDVLKSCGRPFVEAIASAVDVKSYMPGQTICIMGARDASQMFLLRSGCVVVERFGKKMVVKHAGSTMGELMMLGVVSTRSATIRALTFCTMMEVPRAAFMATVERFPEERMRFEHLAMQNVEMQTVWPFLRDVPSRMHLWLNMHAIYKALNPGDRSLRQLPFVNAAILVVKGEAVVLSPDGEEISRLGPGDSFNEHVLLGLPNLTGAYVVPKTACQFQAVTEEVWRTFLAEFESDQETCRRRVLMHLAERAERRLGVEPGSTAMLRRSGLFRKASEELAELLRQCLKHSTYLPGTVITEIGKTSSLFIILDGLVVAEPLPLPQEDLRGPQELLPGSVFGEAVLVGSSQGSTHAYRAAGSDITLVTELRQADFKRVLQDRLVDRLHFDALAVRKQEDLGQRLMRSTALRGCAEEFLATALKDVEDVFYSPGDIIIARGESCCLGTTPFFVLLSGQAVVLVENDVRVGCIGMGEVFGEAGAMGLSFLRTATVRAAGPGIVHCAKLHGQYIAEALNTGSSEGALGDVFAKRAAANIRTQQTRSKWLEESVLPALGMSALFADWPRGLLEALAGPLTDSSYSPGELITSAGEEADSMLVVLHGTVQAETAAGTKLGLLKEGASIGEVAALGLFATRTATLRGGPGGGCRVLELPAGVLQTALGAPGAEAVKQRADRVIACRNQQVAKGLPISVLPISVPPDNVAVRAIALLAERLELAPGEILQPLKDDGPCGSHFGVLVKGRANLEVVFDSRIVMQLTPGSLFIEGQAADYGAQLRATTPCEAYRVREIDLEAAARAAKGTQDWYYRFRVLEKKARAEGTHRLKNALGCSQGLAPHPIDKDIKSWKVHRFQCLERAKQRREMRQESNGRQVLPRVESAPSLGSTPAGSCILSVSSPFPEPWQTRQGQLLSVPSADDLPDRPPSALSAPLRPEPRRAWGGSQTDSRLGTPESSQVLGQKRRPMGAGMVPLEGIRPRWELPPSCFGEVSDVFRRTNRVMPRRRAAMVGAGACW